MCSRTNRNVLISCFKRRFSNSLNFNPSHHSRFSPVSIFPCGACMLCRCKRLCIRSLYISGFGRAFQNPFICLSQFLFPPCPETFHPNTSRLKHDLLSSIQASTGDVMLGITPPDLRHLCPS